MPSVKVLDRAKDDSFVEFELSDISLSVVSALRRTLLTETPRAGVDASTVSFYADDGHLNETSMDSEMLTTRIRLLPVKVDPKHYKDYEIHICNPSDPGAPFENATDANVYYTTFEMVVLRAGAPVPATEVFATDFILTQLKPGQRLKTSFRLAYRDAKGSPGQGGAGKNRDYAWQSCWIERWEYKTAAPGGVVRTIDDEQNYVGRETRTPKAFVVKVVTDNYFHEDSVEVVRNVLHTLIAKVERCREAFAGKVLYDEAYVALRDSDGAIRESAYLVAHRDLAVPGKEYYRIFGDEDDTLGFMLSQRIARLQSDFYAAHGAPGELRRQFAAYKKNPFEELVLSVRTDPETALGKSVPPVQMVARACVEIAKELSALSKAWNKAVG